MAEEAANWLLSLSFLSFPQVDRHHASELEAKWRAAEEACVELERERDLLTKALPSSEKSRFILFTG